MASYFFDDALSYTVGDPLDITGLVVTGTYSDGSTTAESITAANITGFNSATAVVDQVLTITVGAQTTTYKVQIAAITPVTYTVTFNSQGGSEVTSTSNVTTGSAITAPTAPTQTGYTFDGWYKEAGCTNAWNFNTDTVTNDVTIYAKWTANSAVTVSSVVVKTAPTKVTYTAGDPLDLTGLVVTLSKSDASTQDVAFADFAANGISTVKANGAALVSSDTAVEITVNGKTASQAITVKAATLSYESSSVDSTNKKVTLTFNNEIFDNTNTPDQLKNSITFAADGVNLKALSASDTVALKDKTLVITFGTALLGTKNKIEIAANTLKDSTGKVLETPVITATINAFDECFIATAAFGSKNQTDVVLLRHFRDQFLLTNPIGRLFVQTYYHYSPPIAQFIAGNVILKFVTRVLLLPFVAIVYMLFHPVLFVGILVALAFLLVQRRRREVVLGAK